MRKRRKLLHEPVTTASEADWAHKSDPRTIRYPYRPPRGFSFRIRVRGPEKKS